MASGGVGSRFLPLFLQKLVACIALRDFLSSKRGVFPGDCGAFFPWGVLRGRVVLFVIEASRS